MPRPKGLRHKWGPTAKSRCLREGCMWVRDRGYIPARYFNLQGSAMGQTEAPVCDGHVLPSAKQRRHEESLWATAEAAFGTEGDCECPPTEGHNHPRASTGAETPCFVLGGKQPAMVDQGYYGNDAACVVCGKQTTCYVASPEWTCGCGGRIKPLGIKAKAEPCGQCKAHNHDWCETDKSGKTCCCDRLGIEGGSKSTGEQMASPEVQEQLRQLRLAKEEVSE